MKRIATLLVLALAALFLGACCRGPRGPHGPGAMMGGPGGRCANCPAHGAAADTRQAASAIYWCGGLTDGAASAVSTAPGTCPDGKPMNGGHVVRTEGNTALVCTCGPACSCAIDPKDPAKCGCGKQVRRLDLTGTGLYFCNCGGSCACNTVSAGPGKCRCGMDLHQAK